MRASTPGFPRALLTLLLIAAGAAGLTAPAVTKPAEAAFPGANGKFVFVSFRTTGAGVNNPEGDTELFVMRPDGTGIEQLTVNDTREFEPAWSADGRWIAYSSHNPVEDVDIYMTSYRDGDFVQTRQLTNNTVLEQQPAFSPDGTKIAFVSNRDGNTELYVVDYSPDAAPPPVNLTNNAASDFDPDWSPDGSKIVFTSDRDGGNLNIYVMNADGSGQKRLTKRAASDSQPVFSPDGTRIAFTSGPAGSDNEIYVMRARPESSTNRPSNRTRNDDGDGAPDWRPVP
jgi:tol-pal system beta propeller repeat protein TolB